MTDETTAGIGHNLPPFETIKQRTDALIDTANRWITERGEIADEDMAGKANDFLTQLRAEFKAADKERKAEKQPHLDAGKAVDAKYKPVTERLEKAANAIKKMLTPWLQKKQREEEEAQRSAQEEARAKAEAEAKRAEELAKEGNAIDAEIAAEEAEQAVKAADKIAEAPVRAGVKGELGRTASLRTTYYGEIADFDKCLDHYKGHVAIRETLEKLVNADIRAGTHTIPGVRVKQQQSAA